MYTVNKGWGKIVTGVINNMGWIIVIALSTLTLLFTQLDTRHKMDGDLASLYMSYEEYGKISRVKPVDVVIEEDKATTIELYYDGIKDYQYNILRESQDLLDLEKQKESPSIVTIRELEGKIDNSELQISNVDKILELIINGKFEGISLDTMINKTNQRFTWTAEYRFNKVIGVATTDVYSWLLAFMLAFSAIIIKIQGNKSGKNSGFKFVWRTTARHARLAEKIAPKAKEAEDLCISMNKDELRIQRENRLRYVAMDYYDVFTEEGTFLKQPKFIEVETDQVIDLKGNVKIVENKYQKKVLKKQLKMVEFLKRYRIKEVHTYVLLESKAEAKEKYDFGESLRSRDRKTTFKNIITSLVTVLPLFTAASVFVVTNDTSNLLVGALGTLFNFVSLLANMFGSYDYILNQWSPSLLKKCDTLLVIANQLGIADEIDNNFDAKIEEELIKASQK